jgi:hypothetical protein
LESKNKDKLKDKKQINELEKKNKEYRSKKKLILFAKVNAKLIH